MRCPTCHRPEACDSSANCPHGSLCSFSNRQTNEDYWWRFGGWLAWCRYEHRREVASNGAYHATTGWAIQI